jgi:hypothetical protein
LTVSYNAEFIVRAENPIHGNDLFDFTRTTPAADRLVEPATSLEMVYEMATSRPMSI